jgi:hypothetical protein
MTEPSTEALEDRKLPLRDWMLLPVLGLVTIVILVCSTELIARQFYSQSTSVGEDCMLLNSSSKTLGGIPNSVCWEKIPEGELTEYRFNSSGYRSNKDFEPKQPGTFRIVVIGSSFAIGARVPIEVAFATTLSSELSKLTGRKVEILNEGMAGDAGYPSIVALRFKDALAAKPDMILRILTPWDIQNESSSIPTTHRYTGPVAQQKSRIDKFLEQHRRSAFMLRPLLYGSRSLYVNVKSFLSDPRSPFMLRHFFYESQSQYMKSFLMSSNSIYNTGFLRTEPNAEWKKQVLRFASDDAAIEERVKAAGVPLVAVLIPFRVQAAMISMGEWGAEFDPFKLDNELRSIITSHGGTYIDILPDFRNIPNPEQGYYPVEGHLNPRGHAMIARLLAKEITSGAVPALSVSTRSQAAQEYRK